MHLFFTDNSFVQGGVSYPNIPFLMDEEMRLTNVANRFLVHQAIHRGATESSGTWRTYGWHLYDYFSFLEANFLCWDELLDPSAPSVVALYRNWSAKNNASRTVNQRLGTVIRFYRYAYRQGWVPELPWDMEDRVIKGQAFIAHVSAKTHASVADVKLKENPAVIEVLTKSQIHQLLEHLHKNKTHYLMAKLALATGLRKEELMTFPQAYIFDPFSRGSELTYKVVLNPDKMLTKGQKKRSIFISRSLMRELWDYSLMERGPIVAFAKEVEKSVSPSLFLNMNAHRYSESAFQKILLRAGKILGFHVHPHILRHSYATHELHSFRAKSHKTTLL